MPKRQSNKSVVEKHEIAGRRVEIHKIEDKEQLWIDGVQHKYSVTPDGYNLHADAYVPPHNSLLEAVKSYLDAASQPPNS